MDNIVSYDEARELVLQHLRGLTPEESEHAPPTEPAIVESETLERPWGWVFYWNTQLFLETGDIEHAVVGPPPLCVTRCGSVEKIDSGDPIEPQLRRYERQIGVRPWWKFW